MKLQETKRGGKKKEKKSVNSKRQGKGKNTSEVETEMKWEKGKKRKHTQRKMMKKAVQTQEGRISSRGWGVLPKNGAGEWNCCYSVGKEDRDCGPQNGCKLVSATEEAIYCP